MSSEPDQLPESIVFIGGGYISFEFAHVANRLGRKVTIIDRNSRPLAGFDGDLVDRLFEHSRSIGIKVITDSSVTSIRQCPNKLLRVEAERNGASVQVEAGLIVHCAGPSSAGPSSAGQWLAAIPGGCDTCCRSTDTLRSLFIPTCFSVGYSEAHFVR